MSLDFVCTMSRLVRCESRTSKIFDVLHHHAMARWPIREPALCECGIRFAVHFLRPCHLIFHVCMIHESQPLVNNFFLFIFLLTCCISPLPFYFYFSLDVLYPRTKRSPEKNALLGTPFHPPVLYTQ